MTTNYSGSSAAAPPQSDTDTTSPGAKEQVKEQAGQVAGTAAEQGRQVAGTAAGEARAVAGTAAGEAQRVVSEASSQVRGLVSEATAQVEEQSRTQLGRLAETLRSFGEDFERMASSGEGPATGLAREAADRTRGLASQLEGREPRDLVEELRGFARRRPGAFLAGSLVAGVVAGRLTRGAKAAHETTQDSSQTSPRSDSLGTGSGVGPDGFAYESAAAGPEVDLDRTGLPNPASSVADGATYGTDTPAGGV
jgi:hypothetical protein